MKLDCGMMITWDIIQQFFKQMRLVIRLSLKRTKVMPAKKVKTSPKLWISVIFYFFVVCFPDSNKTVSKRLLAQQNESETATNFDFKMFLIRPMRSERTLFNVLFSTLLSVHCTYAVHTKKFRCQFHIMWRLLSELWLLLNVMVLLWFVSGRYRENIKCDTFLNMTIDQVYF